MSSIGRNWTRSRSERRLTVWQKTQECPETVTLRYQRTDTYQRISEDSAACEALQQKMLELTELHKAETAHQREEVLSHRTLGEQVFLRIRYWWRCVRGFWTEHATASWHACPMNVTRRLSKSTKRRLIWKVSITACSSKIDKTTAEQFTLDGDVSEYLAELTEHSSS